MGLNYLALHTQKMKLSIKDFFSKCNRTAETAGNCGFGHISEEILNRKRFVQCYHRSIKHKE